MKRALLLLGIAALALLVAWWLGALAPRAGRAGGPTSAPVKISPGPGSQTRGGHAPAPAADEESSHLADALNAPAGDIRADLRIVSGIIEAFRTNFPREGNPVGDNAEITAALTGQNRLGLALVPRRHPAINQNGELCDRWGTPFFFHAESAHKMEIRSAGPDRKMWNADDVVFTP